MRCCLIRTSVRSCAPWAFRTHQFLGRNSPGWSTAGRGPGLEWPAPGSVRRYEPKPERRPDPKPERRRPSARAGSRALATPYAELHCHSNASFLDGASPPEELVEEAANLGLEAIALTDRDGMYGVVRFAEAAKAFGMRTVFGAELTLGLASARPTLPDPDPSGEHLLVLARDPEGYARLCRAISTAQLAGSKGAPRASLELLAGLHGGRWLVLTGCRKGAVPSALVEHGPAAAGYQLDRLIETFGRDNVLVEIWDHGGGHQQRPLRHPASAPAGGRARRGARAPLARRAGRLAARVGRRAPAFWI